MKIGLLVVCLDHFSARFGLMTTLARTPSACRHAWWLPAPLSYPAIFRVMRLSPVTTFASVDGMDRTGSNGGSAYSISTKGWSVRFIAQTVLSTAQP